MFVPCTCLEKPKGVSVSHTEEKMLPTGEAITNTRRDLCIICQAPAIMPLARGHVKTQACLQHMGEAHNLLRVSREFFQGFSF